MISHTPSPRQLSICTLNNFRRNGFSVLADVGVWLSHDLSPLPYSFSPLPLTFSSAQYYLTRDWPLLASWLQTLPRYLEFLSYPDILSLLPRVVRRNLAECTILSLFSLSPHFSHPAPPSFYASDASLHSSHHSNSVIFASLAHGNAFAGSLDSFGPQPSVLQGEAYGITACLTLLHASTSPCTPTNQFHLFTDHLNSIHSLNSLSTLPHQLSHNPARSLYRWIINIRRRMAGKNDMQTTLLQLENDRPPFDFINHVRAHTTSSSIPSCMNRLADNIASKSQLSPLRPLSVPVPTFFMDPFMPYHSTHGFIESAVSPFLANLLACAALPNYPPWIVSRLLYDDHNPPSYPYTHASSAYSAVIQLYARSDQLDSASTLAKRLPASAQPWCRFGCPVFETTHHIFTACPRFLCLRGCATQKLTLAVSTTLETFRTSPHDHPLLMSIIDGLFYNGDVWPTAHSLYYYGIIPVLQLHSVSTRLEHRRLLC